MHVRDSNEPASLLGEQPPRLPISGKIRPGIKVLTKSAAKNPKVVKIFTDSVAYGLGYGDIERLLDAEGVKNGLTPRNTPYFRVAKRDFTAPDMAARIIQLYGEDRGDGVQLYRFPIVLPFDNWQANMPHGFASYVKSGREFWSQYDAAGARYCMQYAAPEIQNERARRSWGGRRFVIRAENEGRCVPDKCPQYQARTCKLTGTLVFYVPGIPGCGLIELPTTSYYSLAQMRSQLELVQRLRNGRLSGTFQGKPIFYLTKREEEVSVLDDQGQPQKRKQFLVKMETDIEMFQMMAAQEAITNIPAQALPAPEPEPPTDAAPEASSEQAPAAPPVVAGADPFASAPKEPAAKGSKVSPLLVQLRKDVTTLLETKHVEAASFKAYAEKKHGKDWWKSASALTALQFDLESR